MTAFTSGSFDFSRREKESVEHQQHNGGLFCDWKRAMRGDAYGFMRS